MFESFRAFLLRVLRVPSEPEPPFGDPTSIRVFRASRKLYLLRLIGWGVGQGFALAGVIFWLGVLLAAEHEARKAHQQVVAERQSPPAAGPARQQPPNRAFKQMAARVPPGVFALLWVAKGVGVLIYLAQLAVTYSAVRLDYEMRWYVVTDRSLRIRAGIWRVQEMTMSFANLQQVMVTQGPLQRMLGIADVRVESAGGGGIKQAAGGHGIQESMHTGIFHGVENATEIRDLILDRLRHFRETGLGDPDEVRHVYHPAEAAPLLSAAGADATGLLAAARELRAEARQLRAAMAPADRADG